ncbi:hypothetical protein [Streptomyces chartreusis]
MTNPADLRARADELESRVPPVHAGPRTDDERMWLEKATALRDEADQIEAEAQHAATEANPASARRAGPAEV